jgi:hypothetical protein
LAESTHGQRFDAYLVGDFNGTAQNPLSAQRRAGLWIRVGWAGHVHSFRQLLGLLVLTAY